jgi:hypothetical protein
MRWLSVCSGLTGMSTYPMVLGDVVKVGPRTTVDRRLGLAGNLFSAHWSPPHKSPHWPVSFKAPVKCSRIALTACEEVFGRR